VANLKFISCSNCGWEDYVEDNDITLSGSYANGDFAYCPGCRAETPIQDVLEEELDGEGAV
jgi:hypothetical protein